VAVAANVIVQQALVSSGVVFAECIKAGEMHILNKVLDFNITLLGSLLLLLTIQAGLSFFVIFVHLVVVM